VNSLRGYICNVFSNSYCIDMRNSISASNSDYGQCSCTVTKSCVKSTTVCVCCQFNPDRISTDVNCIDFDESIK